MWSAVKHPDKVMVIGFIIHNFFKVMSVFLLKFRRLILFGRGSKICYKITFLLHVAIYCKTCGA